MILGIHTRAMPLAKDVDLGSLAKRTERYTGADLEDVVRRAGLTAIRKGGEKATEVTAARAARGHQAVDLVDEDHARRDLAGPGEQAADLLLALAVPL